MVRSKEVEVCDSEREERETGGVGKGISSAVIVPKKKLVRHDLPKKEDGNRKADQKVKQNAGVSSSHHRQHAQETKATIATLREIPHRLRNVKSIFVSHS